MFGNWDIPKLIALRLVMFSLQEIHLFVNCFSTFLNVALIAFVSIFYSFHVIM